MSSLASLLVSVHGRPLSVKPCLFKSMHEWQRVFLARSDSFDATANVLAIFTDTSNIADTPDTDSISTAYLQWSDIQVNHIF
jgi:hypothetical protein